LTAAGKARRASVMREVIEARVKNPGGVAVGRIRPQTIK
jgi:hypothetical protein